MPAEADGLELPGRKTLPGPEQDAQTIAGSTQRLSVSRRSEEDTEELMEGLNAHRSGPHCGRRGSVIKDAPGRLTERASTRGAPSSGAVPSGAPAEERRGKLGGEVRSDETPGSMRPLLPHPTATEGSASSAAVPDEDALEA